MSGPSRATCVMVDRRDGFCCVRCGVSLEQVSGSRHHRMRRGAGGHGVENLILLCGSGTTGCHQWAHGHPAAARGQGLIIPTWVPLAEIATVPLFTRVGWVQLTADGTRVRILEVLAFEVLALYGMRTQGVAS